MASRPRTEPEENAVALVIAMSIAFSGPEEMGKPRGLACLGASMSTHLQRADTVENGLSLRT